MRNTARFLIIVGLLLPVTASIDSTEEAGLELLCLSPQINPRLRGLDGFTKTILNARRTSELLYFFKLPQPLVRDFEWNGNEIVMNKFGRVLGTNIRIVDLDESGKATLRPARRKRGADVLGQVADIYREVIHELQNARREGEPKISVPFDFLGVKIYQVAGEFFLPKEYDLAKVRSGYDRNPSDLASLAYLELALIERERGKANEFKKLIDRAVSELKLEDIDYREDVRFRLHLHGAYNFARPESYLLFLAGENAQEKKMHAIAKKFYSILIERAPGSPLAWEALTKIIEQSNILPRDMENLKSILLNNYPLIWGCPRADFHLEKDAFSEELPALLRKAAEEQAKEN